MRTAARVGAAFGIDPVAILDEPSTFRRQIREAAFLVWVEDENRRWSVNDGG